MFAWGDLLQIKKQGKASKKISKQKVPQARGLTSFLHPGREPGCSSPVYPVAFTMPYLSLQGRWKTKLHSLLNKEAILCCYAVHALQGHLILSVALGFLE